MFELLRYVKNAANLNKIPFICMKLFAGVLHDGTYSGVERAASLMGASAFIDFSRWYIELGPTGATDRLHSRIKELIVIRSMGAGNRHLRCQHLL
ncbi:hypothetical protein ACFQUU_22680 [Herbaspirillum sp. GCM10030257]|uniref:hypothetical protein n=1 Tax=Herbaspirillum sp. GCM10030257 TaxID=3273393 RepID=UPI00361C1997